MNIRNLRKDRGMTQMQMARECKVSLATIRLWENEAGFPNNENKKKLEAMFGEKYE